MDASLSRAIAECRYLLRELDPEGTARAAAQVGLVTHKDCERALAEALGIPEHRSGHFWGMRGSNRLEDCTILRARGHTCCSARTTWRGWHGRTITPIQRLIDESSERAEDGTWCYRDPRMRAEWRMASYAPS